MRSRFVAALFVLCFASPVFAQDRPAFDISGGYSFLRDSELEENFHGWLASVGVNISDSLGIVGEVGANSKSVDIGFDTVDVSITSFMAGPRYAFGATPKVNPYVQVLLGGARGSAEVLGESDSSTEFALQPGVGFDVWLGSNFGVRLGGDYRRILGDDGSNEFRFHAGVVIKGGSR